MSEQTPHGADNKPYPTLSTAQVLYWIADHSDDQEAMEKINKATFPFTSKYQSFKKPGKKLYSVDPTDEVFVPEWTQDVL